MLRPALEVLGLRDTNRHQAGPHPCAPRSAGWTQGALHAQMRRKGVWEESVSLSEVCLAKMFGGRAFSLGADLYQLRCRYLF